MIYRIQTTSFWRDEDEAGNVEAGPLRTSRGGAFFGNSDYWDAIGAMMDVAGLRAPAKKVNPRAKFWFTELGYNVVGKEIVRFLSLKGENVRVLKKKNPKRSDVAWGDAYQLAVLPIK